MVRLVRSDRVRPAGGFVLPAVLILSFVAAIISAMFLFRADSSSLETGDQLRRRRAFYAADGMSRLVVQEVQNYMVENPDPSTSDLQNPDNISPPQLEGYVTARFDVESLGEAFDGPIPNGPFEGMYGHQKPIMVELAIRQDNADVSSQVKLGVTLAQVSMFQFFVFGDGYTELFPGPNMTINPGRVHANGDLCIGSASRLEIEWVTSANRLLASDGRCRSAGGSGAWLWNGTDYHFIESRNSSGCTNCEGTGLKWDAYAVSTWRGYARDGAQGVPRLRLPITSVARTQASMNAAGGLVSNASNSRLLVDPVLAGDAQDLLKQKFAWQADLRIINGVWYQNDGTWPGQPIWSDHPGSFRTTNEEGIEGPSRAVGQDDLRAALGWVTLPRRFSFYEYDAAQQRLADGGEGVLSYGSLARVSSSLWTPGYWAAGAQGHRFTDVDGRLKDDFCAYCGNAPCAAPAALRPSSEALCQYHAGTGYQDARDAQYLQATRGGFLDYRVRRSDAARGAILPVNFDLAAFAAAMADVTPGELGSYFGGGRDFNGIVYITSTWPGSMAGLPDGSASLWPAQGAVTDEGQAVTWATPMAQRGLPFELCSSSLGYDPAGVRTGYSGPPSDGNPANGFEPWFTVPSCDSSRSSTSRPNAVRLINASQIDSARFPHGLSLVSNLPVYVMGDFNSASDTSSPAAVPWSPVMVGADAVTLLSRAWNDRFAAWDNSGAYSSRVATASTYNLELLAGNVETTDSGHYSGGIENFPRFLENWTGKAANINGSFVVGFGSVYQRQPWVYGGPVYDAPTRNWKFDLHLRTLAHQPPGVPRFSIHSVSRLDRP